MKARWLAFKEALVLALRNWRLWLLQFFGNAVIVLAFVWWLHFSDAHWWNLLFTLVLIVILAVAALVLCGGTLNYFQAVHQDKTAKLSPAFRKALKHLAAFFVWALVFVLLWRLAVRLDNYSETLPGYLRSEFPAWLRRMVSEPRLDQLYRGFVWVLLWIVLPGLLLPFGLSTASKGFRGLIALGDWRRMLGSLIYWITLLVAAILGVYVVGEIMGWKLNPQTATLSGEEISLGFRLCFSSVLGIFAWLLTCSMLGRLYASRQAKVQPE